jgi:glycosyltransferase involved in cell wall biosynthesis
MPMVPITGCYDRYTLTLLPQQSGVRLETAPYNSEMRLVHYYPRALVGDGGPTRAMWEWAGATYNAGCDVAVLYDAALVGVSPLRNPSVPLIPLTHVGAILSLRLPRRLGRVLDRGDVLVLHSTYVPGNVTAAWSANRHGIPYVVMPHGGYNRQARRRRHRRKQAWLPVERAYLERALAVHLFFKTETNDVSQLAPNARWIIAPTGFELPVTEWDRGSGGYLAWLGRYDICTKGLDLLIDAMTQLPEQDRRPLRLHGKASENEPIDVETLAVAAGATDLVTVGGVVTGKAKADFLRSAAAYVHPSRWESHSLALLEALAYGIPSVVSASCSIAAELRAADAAVIVQPTPTEIARGISAVLRRPQYYSDRALHFVRTSMTWAAIIDQYLAQIDHLSSEPYGRSLEAS